MRLIRRGKPRLPWREVRIEFAAIQIAARADSGKGGRVSAQAFGVHNARPNVARAGQP